MRKIDIIVAAIATAVAITCISFTAHAESPYSSIEISDEEANLLRWVVALEAQGEGYEGEKLVTEVIFNRVLSDKWPNTVGEVLRQRKQFSTLKYVGSKKAWAIPGETEDDAISDVLRSETPLLPSLRYVYFDTRGRNGRDKIRIGGHYFGRE